MLLLLGSAAVVPVCQLVSEKVLAELLSVFKGEERIYSTEREVSVDDALESSATAFQTI